MSYILKFRSLLDSTIPIRQPILFSHLEDAEEEFNIQKDKAQNTLLILEEIRHKYRNHIYYPSNRKIHQHRCIVKPKKKVKK